LKVTRNPNAVFNSNDSFKIEPLFFLLLCLGCSSTSEPALIFKGKVVSVIDGDTVDILYDGHSYRIRLADIDCPESDQPYGHEATEFVSRQCLLDSVNVKTEGDWDPYGRLVATIFVQDTINLNFELIKEGLAWHYKHYSDDQEYSDAEDKARKRHIMLWSDSNPVAPWDWRN
jgi:micrococcal nuclease